MSSECAKSVSAAPAGAPRRRGSRLRSVALQVGILLLCLAGTELFLRVVDFRDLRLIPEPYRLPYQHDPEIGWVPVAHKVTSAGVRINSLGLRDIELEPATKPTILFIGDSFVYGSGVKDGNVSPTACARSCQAFASLMQASPLSAPTRSFCGCCGCGRCCIRAWLF